MAALSTCGYVSDDSRSAKSSRSTLSSLVSRWERPEVARNLHIYFHDDYTANYSEVYDKMEMAELDEEQRTHFEKIKSHLSSINTSLRDIKYFPETFMNILEQISTQLVNEESDEHIKRIVSGFLKCLIDMMMKIKNRKAYEGGYTRLLDSFSYMFGLHTQVSLSKDDQVVWPKLTGIKHVISKPDMRLFKHGVTTTMESIRGRMLVSVIEVKKDSLKDSDEMELQIQRLENTDLSSSCSSLEESEGDEKIPLIEFDLDRKVLGQHAGDLLLDLYQYHRDVELPIMTMPGMIIDGTDVFLTMLEISKCHFRKLERNQDLDQEDKAFIYYSKPLNILDEKERNILMEILIRLNNLEYKAG